jgi:hypothetical protein
VLRGENMNNKKILSIFLDIILLLTQSLCFYCYFTVIFNIFPQDKGLQMVVVILYGMPVFVVLAIANLALRRFLGLDMIRLLLPVFSLLLSIWMLGKVFFYLGFFINTALIILTIFLAIRRKPVTKTEK